MRADPHGTKTVVVVDDERDIRDTLRDAFEDEGYAVATAANGEEALGLLRKTQRPCVVIVDIIMPVMSGSELYSALRADPALKDIPVVVSTSDPSRAPAGVLIMRKPIDLDRLIGAVASLF
jgi:CheY-like chemotaxis protein